jgi:protein TonB
MKQLVLSALFLLSYNSTFSQENFEFKDSPKTSISKDDKTVYTFVDKIAEFKGGTDKMYKFLSNNIRYPQSAIDNNISGKCYIKFIVEKNGQISNAIIQRGIENCSDCNNEALRVVKSMPKWKPSLLNGKKVRSYFLLPINFKLV